MIAGALAVALLTALGLTHVVRRYALSHSILDVPNARSSHSVPTPRGGGAAIVVVAIGGFGFATLAGWLEVRTLVALAGGGALVAFIGWRDDRGHVPAAARFAVHVLAAIWALSWLGGLQRITFGSTALEVGSLGWALGVTGIVWFTNLFNFMDGIDGIAAGEAASVAGLAGALMLMSGDRGIGLAALFVCASSIGFLVWNWPPARIFMGDVGSGTLGFLLAVLAIDSEGRGALPLVGWIVLLGVFVFDATVTLLRRVAARERWHTAHRSHAYQRAVRAGASHGAVSGTVIGLNVLLALIVWSAPHLPGGWFLALPLALVLLAGTYLAVEWFAPMQTSSNNRVIEENS